MTFIEGPAYFTAVLGAYVQSRFIDLLVPLGIRPQHFGALRRIAAHDGCTQQEVADVMHVRRNVMVGLVDALENDGLVRRDRHPVDRRANALHLTAEGRRVLLEAEAVSVRLDVELLAALDPGDRAAIRRALPLIAGSVGADAGSFAENTVRTSNLPSAG